MTESSRTSNRDMEFCDFCVELIRLIAAPEDTGRSVTTPLIKHPEITCNFCEQLMEELQRQLPDTFECLDVSPQRLDFYRHMHTWGTHTTSYVEVTFQTEHQTMAYRGPTVSAKYALWVDCKSESSHKQFSNRAPILSPGIDDTRNQVQYWLNKCSSDHPDCSIDRVTKLPTRVLLLSEDTYGPKIRLIESKGTRGEYCALSHCWGSDDKRPLRTTSSKLQQHLFDIPYKQLPLTFQESVMLVHSLGFKYLWIDSLCILQDNPSDWQSEAKGMRNVYHNASLVIAASGAVDSSQGLFIQSRPHALVTKVPFDAHDETKGHFNAALIPWSGQRSPCYGVLNTRAWALQERYLARRFIAFMPGGISWICDSIKLDELEQPTDHGFRETNSWDTLLESYTKQQLTFPADRLEALRGIVAEIQEARKDQFDFRYGIWKKTVHEDLLWLPQTRDSSSNVLDLPTWSWAATGGAKRWCRSFCHGEILRLPGRLEAKDFGSMHAKGHLTKASPVLQMIPKQLLSRFDEWRYSPAPYGLEYQFTYSRRSASESEVYSIVGGSNSSILMGIAFFDRRNPTPHARYFIIGSTVRTVLTKEADNRGRIRYRPLVNDKDTAAYDAEQYESEILSWDEDFAKTSDWVEYSEEMSAEDEQTARQYEFLHDKTCYVYFCLILEPVSEGKYKRVGLAMLYPHAMKGLDATVEEFEVI